MELTPTPRSHLSDPPPNGEDSLAKARADLDAAQQKLDEATCALRWAERDEAKRRKYARLGGPPASL